MEEVSLQKNANELGLKTLFHQTQEECGELIVAISKVMRVMGEGQKTETTLLDAHCKLVEELTDVEICIESIKYLLKIKNDVIKEAKIQKVANRIKKER